MRFLYPIMLFLVLLKHVWCIYFSLVHSRVCSTTRKVPLSLSRVSGIPSQTPNIFLRSSSWGTGTQSASISTRFPQADVSHSSHWSAGLWSEELRIFSVFPYLKSQGRLFRSACWGWGCHWVNQCRWFGVSSHSSHCVCISSFLNVSDFPPRCCSEVKVEGVYEHRY